MEPEAKTKRTQGSSATMACDRLSSLPDCLIHHIMSFMKAQQVVQTCVLATRWRHLWRSVPCLDIDEDEFRTAGPNRNVDKEWEQFGDFTDHLLIPNNISIALLDTFRLHVYPSHYGYYSRQLAARWIRHGIKYSAQGLSASSWRLKRLHISGAELDDLFAEHVRSGCPYLADLELNCGLLFHEITSHSLRTLILKNCWRSRISAITTPRLQSLVIDQCDCASSDAVLVIMAPAVAYLHLDLNVYYFDGVVSLNEMTSLVKASIHLRKNHEYQRKLGDNQLKLLDGVTNATHLYLSEFKAMVLNEEFPKFQNLRTLSLKQCDLSDNFQMLVHFLQNAPNLEKLTLHCCKFSNDTKTKKGRARMKKLCLNEIDVQCKDLKLTEIIYEDDDVQKLVELLLSISGNLPNNNIKLNKQG